MEDHLSDTNYVDERARHQEDEQMVITLYYP